MKYKDTPEIPTALRKLLTRDLHVTSGKYSVTQLIGPPRISELRKRHADEIEVDPYDRIWLLFGTLAHLQLEAVESKNALSEEHLIVELDGVKVSGTADVYEDDCIYDYKTTSAYSVKDGVKPEWQSQLNIYRYMYANHGLIASKLKIVAILRDWSATQAKKDDGYPQKPIVVLPVEAWNLSVTESYLRQRIQLHENAAKLPDDQLPECTADERWCKPAVYAIMKQGRKSAVKLCRDKFEADVELANYDNKHSIVFRPGESVRCKSYCEVSQFCSTWKAIQEEVESE